MFQSGNAKKEEGKGGDPYAGAIAKMFSCPLLVGYLLEQEQNPPSGNAKLVSRQSYKTLVDDEFAP